MSRARQTTSKNKMQTVTVSNFFLGKTDLVKFNFEAYHLFISQIASSLEGKWVADYDYAVQPNMRGWHRIVEQQKGYILDFCIDANINSRYRADLAKIRVRAVFGYSEEDRIAKEFSERYGKEINVSINKGSDKIAREISRRLLPEYTQEFDRQMAINKHWTVLEEKGTKLANEIGSVLGIETDKSSFKYQHMEVGGGRPVKAEVRVIDNNQRAKVCLEFPVDKAAELMEFILSNLH